MKKPLGAFVFDLDGVITNTAEYHFIAWKALAEELGITFTRTDNERLKGLSRMDSLERILQMGGRTGQFSAEEKEKLAAKKNNHYITLIQRIKPSDVLPGMKEFIFAVKDKDFKLGLASASKNAAAVMESLRLKEVFDVIVDANTITHGKPHPEVFLTAAKLLNVGPSQCIGFEDAAAGVEAIKRAGMFAVAIGPKEYFPHADIVYEKTEDVSLKEILFFFQKAQM